jgi:hypothetical protein
MPRYFESLAITQPELTAQWHPKLNENLMPTDVTQGSNRKIWWLGKCNHEWDSIISSRVTGAGCPYCSGTKVLKGFNDLQSQNVKLAQQWHTELNTSLLPEEVLATSSTKRWWQDEYNHEWQASPRSRHVENTNCPYCTNQKLLVGFNDLATKYPDIAAQWHSTKNDGLLPSNVTAQSVKKYWWQDQYGHEWYTRVLDRTTKGQNCSICANQTVLLGFNDLATTHPSLALEWHPVKNGQVFSTEVNAGSHKKAWWLGSCSHSWETTIENRARNGLGCPICANQTILAGFNDLATTHPQLLTEWHPTKNKTLKPHMIAAGSSARKVWWLCPLDHTYAMKPNTRSSKQQGGCPTCARKRYVSNPELELYAFMTSLGFDVEQSNRTLLRGKEIDLYVPSRRLAVEFNGLYWHSEAQGKDKRYHKAKYEAALAAGIQLVQIWEDDWRDRKPQVMRALAHKLGVTDKLAQVRPELADVTSKVFARKTKVVLLTTEQAQVFLESNHIQGFASGSYYLGLEGLDGVLRAVMVLKREADAVLNIVRYATAGSVTGGFTKLLTHATKTYRPSSFMTFADHTISDGRLYEQHGFVVDKVIAPDYMYLLNNTRKHKSSYTEQSLAEKELSRLNKLSRIWDAGQTRYKLQVS